MIILKFYRDISKRLLAEYNIYSHCGNSLIIMTSNKKVLKQKSITDFSTATKSDNGNMKEQGKEKKEEFEFFFGAKFVFSQFHPAKFVVEKVTYNCMEQYMHHQKA
ncbi:uncharacterized protein LOC132717722, partial [Ruditapes philippinarum]|uniref:uncharacterized protein LOC132717722 n=1 Tax=Ruditapes philippinarum TaxID=129788 RepID=UPI00295B3237